MQIRIIIEHKYSSSHKKKNRSADNVKKEKMKFLYSFSQIKRETLKFQKPIQD